MLAASRSLLNRHWTVVKLASAWLCHCCVNIARTSVAVTARCGTWLADYPGLCLNTQSVPRSKHLSGLKASLVNTVCGSVTRHAWVPTPAWGIWRWKDVSWRFDTWCTWCNCDEGASVYCLEYGAAEEVEVLWTGVQEEDAREVEVLWTGVQEEDACPWLDRTGGHSPSWGCSQVQICVLQRHCAPPLGVCCPLMRDWMSDVIGPLTLEDQATPRSRNIGQQTPSDGEQNADLIGTASKACKHPRLLDT
jgi:hypothetical protein